MKHRKIHISWLVTWASLGLLLGSSLALITLRFTGIEWLFVAGALGFIGFMRRDVTAAILLLFAGLLIGLHRAGNELQSQNQFHQFFGKQIEVQGKVSEDPSLDIDGDQKIRLNDIVIDGKSISGQLWMVSSEQLDIQRSDLLTAEGILSEGFGTIPAAMYRADITGIARTAYADVGRDVRDSLADGIHESIQEPEASLGAGFLLGQKNSLPEKLEQDLRLLGLTHIVVASGYNLTILVRFARRLFARISRFSALAFSGLLIVMFAQMTGFSPSMSRASLIAGLSLLAWYFGRKFHPLVLLAFSAAVTVFINPSYAWGDLGWLLSFTSFIGVIMLAPLINAYFWGDKKPGNVRQVFIETMAAQILTLPIIAVAFGQYSALALLANVLILPLIPAAMLLTGVASIGGIVLNGWLPQIIGWPAETVMRYMTAVISRLSEFPSASKEVVVGMSFAIVYYVFLLSVGIYFWRHSRFQFRNYNVVE